MSKISSIYRSYKGSLDSSHTAFTDGLVETSKTTKEFYDGFLKELVVNLGTNYENEHARDRIHRNLKHFFDGDEVLNFVAIDGTCLKHEAFDFISFFGGAYGAKGQIHLSGHPPKVRYERWPMRDDVSLVAFIPVPYTQVIDVAGSDYEEKFIASEEDVGNLASIHTQLMQLAEVYLAYQCAVGQTIAKPHLIMMDMSQSSMIASIAVPPSSVSLVGYTFDRRNLTREDVLIALSHPFNRALDIPSTKRYRSYARVIAAMDEARKTEFKWKELQVRSGFDASDFKRAVDYLSGKRRGDEPDNPITLLDSDEQAGTIELISGPVNDSWDFTKGLFRSVCERLFLKKEAEALKYETIDADGVVRLRWMSTEDIKFLISVGIRALIEECWQRKIMLTGVVKDSASRYFSRNYLGVMKNVGVYPQLSELKVGKLPPTDRSLFELIPCFEDSLLQPWSSIEFDSTFMTVHLSKEERVVGAGGIHVATERLFMRSLAQFFLRKDKNLPSIGHVVFVDRLAFPEEAKNDVEFSSAELGTMRPLVYKDKGVENKLQEMCLYLLHTLTRNHFPEAIGYPTPLHKADMGAKTLLKKVRHLINSSEVKFKSQPLHKTFRQIRDGFRR